MSNFSGLRDIKNIQCTQFPGPDINTYCPYLKESMVQEIFLQSSYVGAQREDKKVFLT